MFVSDFLAILSGNWKLKELIFRDDLEMKYKYKLVFMHASFNHFEKAVFSQVLPNNQFYRVHVPRITSDELSKFFRNLNLTTVCALCYCICFMY